MTDIGKHPHRLDLYVHAGDPIDVAIPILDSAGAIVPLAGWIPGAKAFTPNGLVLHDFGPLIIADRIRVIAAATETKLWQWPVFVARLAVTATSPLGEPFPITTGWLHFYPV